MPRPILSSPPSHIEKLDSYGWKEWFNSVFNRLGDGPFSITGFTVAGRTGGLVGRTLRVGCGRIIGFLRDLEVSTLPISSLACSAVILLLNAL